MSSSHATQSSIASSKAMDDLPTQDESLDRLSHLLRSGTMDEIKKTLHPYRRFAPTPMLKHLAMGFRISGELSRMSLDDLLAQSRSNKTDGALRLLLEAAKEFMLFASTREIDWAKNPSLSDGSIARHLADMSIPGKEPYYGGDNKRTREIRKDLRALLTSYEQQDATGTGDDKEGLPIDPATTVASDADGVKDQEAAS